MCVASRHLDGRAPALTPLPRQVRQPCEAAMVSRAQHSCCPRQLTTCFQARVSPGLAHVAAHGHHACQIHTGAKHAARAECVRFGPNRIPVDAYGPCAFELFDPAERIAYPHCKMQHAKTLVREVATSQGRETADALAHGRETADASALRRQSTGVSL